MAKPIIRPIRRGDVESIVQIDTLVTGIEKSGFLRGLLKAHIREECDADDFLPPDLCQVAEVDGKVVGFVLGDIQSWQFGIPRHGRIVAIGVHPDYRRRGLASRLSEALLGFFHKLDLNRVLCLVKPDDPLHAFFRAIGFTKSEFLVLER